MYYLYHLLPNRRMKKVTAAGGDAHLSSPEKSVAHEMARKLSIRGDYPLTIDTDPNLDGTVDGKKDAMQPTVKSMQS